MPLGPARGALKGTREFVRVVVLSVMSRLLLRDVGSFSAKVGAMLG
jgi:hypothetical protein